MRLREMDGEARIREIVREELAAHEARKSEEGAHRTRTAWLGFGHKLAADGAATSANRLRVAFGLPPVVEERGQHLVRARELEFQGAELEFQATQDVDDPGEHFVDAVGTGRGVALGEDLGDVVDQLFGDGSGIALLPLPRLRASLSGMMLLLLLVRTHRM